jgi:hypothetical protein
MVTIPADPPDEELAPAELRDRVIDVVNLSVSELRAFRDSRYNEAYLDGNSSKAQRGNEPLNNVIRLLDTAESDWEDAADGFNEVAEARELLDFQRRAQAQIRSQGIGANTIADFEDMTFREAASIRWGIDPDNEREWL